MKTGKEIRDILNAPMDLGLEYIADPGQYEREVLNGFTMEVVKYDIPGLDKWVPAKLGQLTVIVGHTNVGKTTVLLFMLAQLIKQKRRILIYSAENRISSIHKQLTKFVFECEQIGSGHMDKIRPFVRYIKHERHFSYRDMLNQATYLIDADYNFDFFLIDPYNALKIDNKEKLNTHDYHYQAAEEMRIFTMTTQKSIFLNCHTVTEAQRVKPDQNGHRPAPMDSDVEGGGKFPNKADDTIVIHRQISSMIEGEKYVSEIHVRKVRNQEFGGEPTPFNDPIKFRFRINRTGFDPMNTTSNIFDYKSMAYND
jgi:archaellum biogenesis ATPase FlaH